ncbi:putative DNA-binding transcriptional regulator AlpA [Oxalobacteraceae bacterium GrIS 1.11]
MPTPTLPEALSGKPFFRVPPAESSPPIRILFIEQLSLLIGKSCTTIRTFVSHVKYKNRNLIPRPFKMPGSRRLCWYESEVLAWIDSTRPAEPPPPRRPRGRPTKVEQLARQQWAGRVEADQAVMPELKRIRSRPTSTAERKA